jgi:hypothetical protein
VSHDCCGGCQGCGGGREAQWKLIGFKEVQSRDVEGHLKALGTRGSLKNDPKKIQRFSKCLLIFGQL